MTSSMLRPGSIVAWRGRRSNAGWRFRSAPEPNFKIVTTLPSDPGVLRCGSECAYSPLSPNFSRSRPCFGRPQEQGSLAIMTGITSLVLKPLLMSAGVCLVAALAPARAELDVAKLKASIETSVEADYPKLETLYKDIHAHPEVAFQEVKTAAKLAAEMRALGFEVTEKIGNTGVVAIYRNG